MKVIFKVFLSNIPNVLSRVRYWPQMSDYLFLEPHLNHIETIHTHIAVSAEVSLYSGGRQDLWCPLLRSHSSKLHIFRTFTRILEMLAAKALMLV